MSDHPNDTVTVLITLDLSALCRAARLGGLPIALDENPLADANGSLALLRLFAKRGILAAIDESFDRLYPPHYPDDASHLDWQTKGSATGSFTSIWWGKAQW